MRSRWTSAGGDGQWLLADLGSVKELTAATLVWYAPRRGVRPYVVEVSRDGKEYAKVHEGVLRGRGTNTQISDFEPANARYVRFVFADGATGVSVYEMGLHAMARDMAGAKR